MMMIIITQYLNLIIKAIYTVLLIENLKHLMKNYNQTTKTIADKKY